MASRRTFHLKDVLLDPGLPADAKIEELNGFKGHVKKELVHEPSISGYFEALCSLMENADSEDKRVVALSHSAVCYLMKRVAMQAPAHIDEKSIMRLGPALLSTIGGDRKIWSGSVKALEAIYLAQPKSFEACLERFCLRDATRIPTLLFVDELVVMHQRNKQNPLETLNQFKSLFLIALNVPEGLTLQDVGLVRDILSKYYTKHSMIVFSKGIKKDTTRSTFLESHTTSDVGPVGSSQNEEEKEADTFNEAQELQSLIKEHSSTSDDLKATNYVTIESLKKDLEEITSPFMANKETEQNWRRRQESVIQLRSIVKGNAPTYFEDDFIYMLKEFQVPDCLSKAVYSLRTSLSVNGSNLIKELALRVGEGLDPLAESIFNPLKGLLSAMKKISSQNSFTSICVLLSGISFHSRIFQQCAQLSRDKNTAPRSFCAIFLRIFIIRFHIKLETYIPQICEWMKRSLSDAQTRVREEMRTTFWYFYKVYPEHASPILEGLSAQLKRALEASIPKHLGVDYLPSYNVSSESSRRSSLGYKTPSFANGMQPSQLQRNSGLRSASDPAGRSTSQALPHSSRERRHFSPMTFLNRNSGHSVAPTKTSNLDTSSPPSPNGHIDLTNELTQDQSNSLIKKYLGAAPNSDRKLSQSRHEIDEMLKYLDSDLANDRSQGLQLLRNLLLLDVRLPCDQIKSSMSQLMTETSSQMKDLLRTQEFFRLIDLETYIELSAINKENPQFLVQNRDASEIVDAVILLLNKTHVDHRDSSMHYIKYRRVIADFCLVVVDCLISNFTVIDDVVFKAVTSQIINIYGGELNTELYSNVLFHLWSHDKRAFVAILTNAPHYTKSSIGRELAARCSEFPLNSINLEEDSNEIIVPEEKFCMEMTMVNPLLTRKRTNSTSSVVINDLKEVGYKGNEENGRELSENVTNHPIVPLMEEEGFTKFGGFSKLSGMTRIVSLYEKDELEEQHDEHVSKLDFEGDTNMSAGRVSNDENAQNVDLSDIFNQNGVIARPTEQRTNANEQLFPVNDALEDKTSNRTNDELKVKESQSNTPMEGSDYDLANVLDEMHIKKEEENSFLASSRRASNDLDIMSHIPSGTVLAHELNDILDRANHVLQLDDLSRAQDCVLQDLSSVPTSKVDEIIHFLLRANECHEFVDWLIAQNGYQDLCQLSSIILDYLASAFTSATELYSQCVQLTICVIILGGKTPFNKLRKEQIKMLYEFMFKSVAVLCSTENDFFYLLCEDARDLLIETNCTWNHYQQAAEPLLESENEVSDTLMSFIAESFIQLLQNSALDEKNVTFMKDQALRLLSSEDTKLRKAGYSYLALLWQRCEDKSTAIWFLELPVSRQNLIKLLSTGLPSKHES
ncbi:LAMI_0E09208g1_1 [Lachancea mirantina]|uniref:Protein STU1 n=1 Tax=Lachancea mirantina TaxID=1230905 RepID=A0A1G4JNS4_9SACH|nr:LAMI_0E09208g1_1 [Lachancea mirantina]